MLSWVMCFYRAISWYLALEKITLAVVCSLSLLSESSECRNGAICAGAMCVCLVPLCLRDCQGIGVCRLKEAL